MEYLFVVLATCLMIIFCTACGETGDMDGGEETVATKAQEKAPGDKIHEAAEDEYAGVQKQTIAGASSVKDALKAMAASEGIFFGEVPEGFPLDLLPLYPGGTIEQSAIDGKGATLLQVVPASKETVLNHYRDYYKKIGLSADEAMNIGGRIIVGFSGSDAEISMTISDREGGKSFVSLAF